MSALVIRLGEAKLHEMNYDEEAFHGYVKNIFRDFQDSELQEPAQGTVMWDYGVASCKRSMNPKGHTCAVHGSKHYVDCRKSILRQTFAHNLHKLRSKISNIPCMDI